MMNDDAHSSMKGLYLYVFRADLVAEAAEETVELNRSWEAFAKRNCEH